MQTRTITALYPMASKKVSIHARFTIFAICQVQISYKYLCILHIDFRNIYEIDKKKKMSLYNLHNDNRGHIFKDI